AGACGATKIGDWPVRFGDAMLLKAEVERGNWREAEKHLRAVDPVLAKVIERVGPCRLRGRRDHFGALCEGMFNQQISTVVADKLYQKFLAYFPRKAVKAELACALSEEQLLAAGLSRQKRSYVRDLAEKFASGEVATKKFARMSDEEIIEKLTIVR